MKPTVFDSVPVTVHIDPESLDEICAMRLKAALSLLIENRQRQFVEDADEVIAAYLTVLKDMLRPNDFDELLVEIGDIGP